MSESICKFCSYFARGWCCVRACIVDATTAACRWFREAAPAMPPFAREEVTK